MPPISADPWKNGPLVAFDFVRQQSIHIRQKRKLFLPIDISTDARYFLVLTKMTHLYTENGAFSLSTAMPTLFGTCAKGYDY